MKSKRTSTHHEFTVVHMTSAHPSFDTRIFLKECRSLAQSGFQTVLVAPHTHDEVRDSVRLIAISKAHNRLSRMTGTAFSALCRALKENADLYHIHDPELIPAGILLRALGKHVIYDAHEDLAAQLASKPYLASIASGLASWFAVGLEKLAGAAMSAVVAATPHIASLYPKNKTVIVQNFALLSEVPASPPPYSSRPNHVIFTGAATAIRGAREMFDAMARLPAESNARLVIAGSVYPVDLELELTETAGWKCLSQYGWLPRIETHNVFRNGRVGLALYHPVPNHLECQPTKLFEYMSWGIPIVAADLPHWRSMIEDIGCALFVDPHDPDAVASAIQWLLQHPDEAESMGLKGFRAVHERFSWDGQAEILVDLYRRLLQC